MRQSIYYTNKSENLETGKAEIIGNTNHIAGIISDKGSMSLFGYYVLYMRFIVEGMSFIKSYETPDNKILDKNIFYYYFHPLTIASMEGLNRVVDKLIEIGSYSKDILFEKNRIQEEIGNVLVKNEIKLQNRSINNYIHFFELKRLFDGKSFSFTDEEKAKKIYKGIENLETILKDMVELHGVGNINGYVYRFVYELYQIGVISKEQLGKIHPLFGFVNDIDIVSPEEINDLFS